MEKFKPDEYYCVEGKDARYLEQLKKRLYSEQRMSGDEMRDAGNRLFLILENAFKAE